MSASYDGDIMLWKIIDCEKLADQTINDVVLVLEYSLKINLNYMMERPILSACFYKQKIVFGDDGFNLKLIDFSEGS